VALLEKRRIKALFHRTQVSQQPLRKASLCFAAGVGFLTRESSSFCS
jgi:hypothetical protein